ncbi:MAG: hypothetical protein AAFX02_01505 [Pseudomonadota bacterium]
MSTIIGDGEEDWKALLTDCGVPRSVIQEAFEGPINPKSATKLAVHIIWLSLVCMLLPVAALLAVLPETDCAGRALVGDIIAVLAGAFSGIFIAALLMALFQTYSPLQKRKSYFIGAFIIQENLPFALMLAKRANKRTGLSPDFRSYERAWMGIAIRFCAIIIGIFWLIALGALLFVPEICMNAAQ